jgi:DNA-binding response OmpR family regulator
MFMASTLVLSVGLDHELLDTRNLVLQSAGYTVVSARSIKEAVDRFQECDFDLVLLCRSIPTKDRERLSTWVRASGSRIPVVWVTGMIWQTNPLASVTVDGDPVALLVGIREALTKPASLAV